MAGVWTGGTQTANVARIITGNKVALSIDTSGNVSLPRASLAQKVEKSGGGALSVGTSTADALNFYTNATNCLTLSSAGLASFPVNDINLTKVGLQSIMKMNSGIFGIGTNGVDDIELGTNGFLRIKLTGAGSIIMPPLNTGGLVLSAAGTGQLSAGALTGDVTTSGLSSTLVNIPNDCAMAGDVLATNIAAPASPAAGKGRIWFDTTGQSLFCKNNSGVSTHTVGTKTPIAGFWLTGVNDFGVFSSAQVQFSDLAGTPPFDLQWALALPPGELTQFNTSQRILAGMFDTDINVLGSASTTWGYNAKVASTSQKFAVAFLGGVALTGTGTVTLSLMKNGSSVATITSFSPTAPADVITNTSISFAAGDRIGIQYSTTGGVTGGSLFLTVSSTFS